MAALGLIAVRGLSLVAASGGYSLFQCAGFSLRWLLLLQSTGSSCAGFNSCGTWSPQLWLVGSRAQAQQLWRTGLVAPRHMRSSWTRARTHVPCIGRRILNHCATREVHIYQFLNKQFRSEFGRWQPQTSSTHAHSWASCLWLHSSCDSNVNQLCQRPSGPQNLKYLLSDSLQEKND